MKLKEFFSHNNPEIVMCHSMGCQFLANYLQTNLLPSSVRKIILLQGDTSRLTQFNTTVPIISSYCYWDYTLWVSVILNRYLPIGLVGSKTVNNKFLVLLQLQPHAQVTNQITMINKMIDQLD